MKALRQVKIGETVKVVKLHGEGAVKRRIMDREHSLGRFPSTDDISEELERTFSAMTREEQEGIIRRISEEKCRENVNRLVRQNFERIKQEVWNIIVTENEKLPNPHDLDRTKKSSEE